MTADANNDLIRQAFAAQMYSVIPKPVNANIVVHTLERALAKVYGLNWDGTQKPSDKKPPKTPSEKHANEDTTPGGKNVAAPG
jgi:hypothetical protein